jgi:hypothetical protein
MDDSERQFLNIYHRIKREIFKLPECEGIISMIGNS